MRSERSGVSPFAYDAAVAGPARGRRRIRNLPLPIRAVDPRVDGGVTGAPGSTTIETLAEPDSLILLDHTEGEEFFASFTVANEGPLPVTIERVLEGGEFGSGGGPFYPVEVLVHPGERFIGTEDIPFEEWDAFSPFSLGEGEDRRVAIRFAFGECNLSRGETFGTDGASTRFSVFGIDRETYYQFPYVLAMKATTDGDCP